MSMSSIQKLTGKLIGKPAGQKMLNEGLKEIAPVAVAVAIEAAPVLLAAGAVYGTVKLIKWVKR